MEPKKKKSKVKWIVIAVLAVIIIGIAASGGADEPKKTGEVTTEKSKSDGDAAGTGGEDTQEATTEAPGNIFHVGDVVETSTLTMTD